MKKKLIVSVLMIIMILTVNVKASSWWDIEVAMQKGDNSGYLYNFMPTEVKRGDIIPVRIIMNNIGGWNISQLENRIIYDNDVFEIVEVDGEYYRELDENISHTSISFDRANEIIIYTFWRDDYIPVSTNLSILELKFRVKSNAKDGVYSIYRDYGDDLSIYVSNQYRLRWTSESELRFQIGKSKMTSSYTKDSVENDTYIIGNHLFTRLGSDEYDGILNTEYIMLASKSIDSEQKNDMIVYRKNNKGQWLNAINGKSVTPPNEFKIDYVDMKANYQENGIYADNNEKVILNLLQLNENEVIVNIETKDEHVEGIGTISNNVINLTSSNKNYKITVNENSAVIETSDTYIVEKNLQRRANNTPSQYYENRYSLMGATSDTNGIRYLNSEYSGKYSLGNYELYFVRLNHGSAKVCLRQKGTNNCIIDDYAYRDDDNKYYIQFEEFAYAFTPGNNNLVVTFTGGENPYVGTYSNDSSLKMNDVFHIWEQNRVLYRVTIDEDTGDSFDWYIPAGMSVSEYYSDFYYYEPYRDGYNFVEWQLNGVEYDFTTPITSSITIKAAWEEIVYPTYNGVYVNGNTNVIKLYDFPYGDVSIQLVDTTNAIESLGYDQKINNNIIAFNINSIAYSISKNGSNINFTSNSTDTIPSGTYERMRDYTMTEYYEDVFKADSTYLTDEKYNAIAINNVYEGTNTMYMFKVAADKVRVIFVTYENYYTYHYFTYTINGDEPLTTTYNAGESKNTITFNADNTQFTVVEYDGDDNVIYDSKYSGIYKFTENITMEKIVNNNRQIYFN